MRFLPLNLPRFSVTILNMSQSLKFDAIGTSWQIDIYDSVGVDAGAENSDALSEADLKSIHEKIMARIAIFDKDYSRFRDDSMVADMSRKTGIYQLPDDAPEMMNLYYKLYALTGALFTPLIGQTLVDAGYDAKYTLEAKEVGAITKPVTWTEALNYDAKKNTLEMKRPELLDFGGIGKGYLIDIVGDILLENSIRNFCIDAGGDILHVCDDENSGGSDDVQNSAPEIPPLRVGLENPENTKQVIGVVEIRNKSICGSSGNRRAWKNFHHIINPHTGESSRKILASWVIAKKTIVADALATCLFFVPPSVLITGGFDFEYLILNNDFSIEKSEGFDAELFS